MMGALCISLEGIKENNDEENDENEMKLKKKIIIKKLKIKKELEKEYVICEARNRNKSSNDKEK